jgi:hypothetical protein
MNKPPKKWWYSTVDRLKKIPTITDAKRAAGWLWYHHLTPAQKIKTLTKKDLQREMLKYYTSIKGNCTKETGAMGKKYQRKKKKHVSDKQRKSLAKGRKVLYSLRKGRRISEPKEPILIKEGFFMDGKKRGRKKSSKAMHGEFIGKKGKAKHRATSHKYMHGAASGFDPAGLALDLAGILSGAIGISFLASFIPIKNAKYKTLIPIIAGIAGLSMPKIAKNRFLNRASLGALTVGGYTLAKTFVPQIPLMGAADTAEGIGYAIDNLPPEEKAILGIAPAQLEYAGEAGEDGESREDMSSGPGEMLGETSMIEGIPGEMLGEYEPVGADSDFE